MEKPDKVERLCEETQGQVADSQVDDEDIPRRSHLGSLQDDEADQTVPEDAQEDQNREDRYDSGLPGLLVPLAKEIL